MATDPRPRDRVLALDQGTTSTRAVVFDRDGLPVATAQEEFPQHLRGGEQGGSAEGGHRKLGIKGEEQPSFDDIGERFRPLLVEAEAHDPTRQRTVTERLESFPIGHARI